MRKEDEPRYGSVAPALADARLDTVSPLVPDDNVAAVIVVDDCYLLQLRDDKQGIFFPNHWGCFGGGLEQGESAVAGLYRELEEELGLRPDPGTVRFFTRFDFDFGFAGLPAIWRIFYEIALTPPQFGRLALGEGSDMRLFAPVAILTSAIQLAPYDAFALWMHINRSRLARTPAPCDRVNSR